MRYSASCLCFILILLNCRQQPSQEDLVHLNGYWEIERVEFADGTEKTYGASTTLDYLQIQGLEGFRKKAYPNINGTFRVTDDAEPFKVRLIDNSFYMNYQNELSQWQELIKNISQDNFTVVNEENITYYYKRYEPISID